MSQYIRNCISKDVTPALSLVLRSSLQVEELDVIGLSRRSPGAAQPPLPQKRQSASLSLWDIETHVRIKVVSAANVNADDLMKVHWLCLFLRLLGANVSRILEYWVPCTFSPLKVFLLDSFSSSQRQKFGCF